MTFDDALDALLAQDISKSLHYQPFVIQQENQYSQGYREDAQDQQTLQQNDAQQPLIANNSKQMSMLDYIKRKQQNKVSNQSFDSEYAQNSTVGKNNSVNNLKNRQPLNKNIQQINRKFDSFLARNQHAQQIKQQNIEQLKFQLQQNDTFQPKINNNSQRIAQQIQDRKPYHVLIQEKQKKIDELREKQFKSTCTFQPTINVNSKQISMQLEKPSIFDYQYQVQQKQQKHSQIKKKVEQQEQQDITYKPQILPLPEYINGQLVNNFNAEQHYQHQTYKYQQKMKQLSEEQQNQQMIEDQECTFKPNIYQNKQRGLNYSNIVQRLKQEEEKLRNIV